MKNTCIWIDFSGQTSGPFQPMANFFPLVRPLSIFARSLLVDLNRVTCLIKLRVAFYAINACRLPFAPLVYTLVRPPMTTSIVNNLVFKVEDKLDYLDQPIPLAPVPAQAGQQVALDALAAHAAWIKGSKEIVGLMLMTMESDIQQNLENHSAYEMLQKQEEGQSVSFYVLKMKGYIDNLERLGHPVSLGFAVSLIFISLRNEINSFVQNYNMHSMGKTVNELHAMLKLHEQTLPNKNAPALHAIRAGKVQKGNKHKKPQPQLAARGQNQEKGKNKLTYAPKPKIPPSPKREDPAKDSIYHQCGDTGHWKRNCPQYLAKLLKNKKLSQGASGSGNGQCVEVEAIGSYHLSLPSGLVIVLNNCHYAPSITRGIISVSRFSIYALSNKRSKSNLDSALLWHCRLGHISKKRIEKLQHDGLLDSTDLKAFEKCASLLVYQKEVENQLGKTIKSLRSDRGGEYISQEFLDHLKDHRIISHRTPPYTLQHNGVSERRNKTLLDMVRSMMSQTTLPKSFWDYTLETAARILNMVPTKKVEKTPYEPRSIKCIFVGYPKETMGYSFYYPPENKVFVSRNAEFLENSLITQEASRGLDYLEIIQEEDTRPSIDTSLNYKEDDLEIDEPQSDIIPICRSTRKRHVPDRMCLYINTEEHELGVLGEPANYKAALLDPQSDKWLNAINVEMQSMKDNEVWDFV
ncbi:zinc finger, CCHC-type containing protein [Tanacetum coccineum]